MAYSEKEYQRTYQREWARRNREKCHARVNANSRKVRLRLRKFLTELKDNKSCLDCNRPYRYYVLEFDHVRGIKQFDITRAVSIRVTMKRLLEEISKCDLVCANCHRERTFSRIRN